MVSKPNSNLVDLTINAVVSQQRSQAKNITLENGTQSQEFDLSANQYEENRHFFLSHYFRNNYEKALSNLPYINSPISITRVDVYVNDNRGRPEDVQRDVLAFSDLGENQPNNPGVVSLPGNALPQNNSNDLYQRLLGNPSIRDLDAQAGAILQTQFNLQDIRDFRKTQVRKLDPDEFTYDPKLGYISLNFSLKTNEVLAVAYEYTTIFGGTYRVGEFPDNIFQR